MSYEPKPIEAYQPKVHKRDWGEEIFVAETPHYLGKVLKMKAGTAGGLQYHVEKDETFYLVSGDAMVFHDIPSYGLTGTRMLPGQAYHIPPGAVHQVKAISDCVFFEASTPHYDDRVRMEEHYGWHDVGGLPTTR